MLRTVKVTNTRNETLDLVLTNEDVGYIVKDIQGLGPVNASIATRTFANVDGVQFQSARREVRNITMKLGFEPDWENQTVESMRWDLYEFFLPKSEISLRFNTGTGKNYDISGYVESCEADLFVKDSSVNVSILCPQPDFIHADTDTFSGFSTAGSSEVDLTYLGTTDTGITFTLFPDRSIGDVTLNITGPDEINRQLLFTEDLIADDVLVISTLFGNKTAIRTRDSVAEVLLQGVSAASSWIQLQRGINRVRVSITGDPVPFTITYKKAYGGL